MSFLYRVECKCGLELAYTCEMDNGNDVIVDVAPCGSCLNAAEVRGANSRNDEVGVLEDKIASLERRLNAADVELERAQDELAANGL